MDNGIEDLITDVYMAVFRSWKDMSAEAFYDKFDGQPSKIFSYLQTTCCNVVISVARRRAIDMLALEDEIAMRSYTPNEWLASRANTTQRISQLLKPQERTILSLYLYGYTKDEIAAQIDRTVSHVRQKLKKSSSRCRTTPICASSSPTSLSVCPQAAPLPRIYSGICTKTDGIFTSERASSVFIAF